MLIGRGSTICLPVIAICGATGTGKSRLAIDIARLFNGEVINVDSMQLYEGLDIATNKVSLPTLYDKIPRLLDESISC